MKFAFLIHSWFPHGGQQRDMLRLAGECLARGHEVTVYTMAWLGQRPEGLRIEIVKVAARAPLARYQGFTERLRGILRKPPPDLTVGFVKMPLLDVYFAADSCFAEKARQQRGLYYRFTPRFRHFSACEQAVFGPQSRTRVLLLSGRQRDGYLRHFPGCEPRLHLLPPGLSVDRKVAARDGSAHRRCREELGIAAREKLILQIGSGFRIKGVDRSLRALAALPEELRRDCRYLLVGNGPARRWLALARLLGIGDRVRILPTRDQVAPLYQAADLLLHPAHSESAGHVLLEATAAGLPVLTTATCGYANHILEANSGTVCAEPFKQRELNDQLREMLGQLDNAPWSENGLRYGRNDELYQLPKAAVDLLENCGFERSPAGTEATTPPLRGTPP